MSRDALKFLGLTSNHLDQSALTLVLFNLRLQGLLVSGAQQFDSEVLLVVGQHGCYCLAGEVMGVVVGGLAGGRQDHDHLPDCVHDGGAVGGDEFLEGGGERGTFGVLAQHDGQILCVLLFVGGDMEGVVEGDWVGEGVPLAKAVRASSNKTTSCLPIMYDYANIPIININRSTFCIYHSKCLFLNHFID